MARRPNKTGRDTADHYITLTRSILEAPAWRALSFSARAVYPYIRLEWHGPNHNNNGRIQLSVRQAAGMAGMGMNAAARAFQELQAKGFLFVTEMAVLGVSGEARAPSYEITEISMPGTDRHGGRRLFANWTKGNDFPVAKHHANNPFGKNGNKIPTPKPRQDRVQNDDVDKSHVAKLVTSCLQRSDDQAQFPAKVFPKIETSLLTTCSNLSHPSRPTTASRSAGAWIGQTGLQHRHLLPPTFQMIS